MSNTVCASLSKQAQQHHVDKVHISTCARTRCEWVAQAAQQALADKEAELEAVSLAESSSSLSSPPSASYLQKEIAVLKCRNDRLLNEAARLRDKLHTQVSWLSNKASTIRTPCRIRPSPE